ncbi:hypothetical protein [Asticcacaulis sp.]|uniref:hypothetical protein n=1 Tax=Asticcacaulis sp. TaxID=1872648 RepID=UPI00262C294C|nr:hypothetical protein [Asticcacaulis sp.]
MRLFIALCLTLLLGCSEKEENFVSSHHESSSILSFGFTPLDLAGKSKTELRKIIADPIRCEAIKYGDKCYYRKNNFEIVFINGLSDWVTIHNPPGTFSNFSLSDVGMKDEPPSFSNNSVKRWDKTQEVLEISVFAGNDDKIEYIYMKSVTK